MGVDVAPAEALPLGLHEGTDLLDDPHARSLG
jgi:hypothetical protein